MTNDGWGNKWPSDGPKLENAVKKDWLTHTSDVTPKAVEVINWPDDPFAWPKAPDLTGWDLGIGERTMLITFENDGFEHTVINQTELKSQGSNLVDAQAYLYFQCDDCNEIFDPHTKSFAKLQEARANAGWKCVWNIDGMGYKVYCTECGEKVNARY